MKTIDFEIIYTLNPQISQRGYVEVPADADEDVEWFYYDQSGMAIPRMFTHHDGIGISQIGATKEQEKELDDFIRQVQYNFVDFVTDVICQSRESDNKTYRKGNLIIKINEGAKFEIEVFDYSSNGEWDSDYYNGFKLYFNQELIELDDRVYFEDPFTYDEIQVSDILFENGMYVVELPKNCCNVHFDSPLRETALNEYKEAFECAYVKSLVKELDVYGIAHSFITQRLIEDGSMKVFDEGFIQDCANSSEDSFEENEVIELYFMTSDDVESIIKEEYEEELQNTRDAQRDYEEECRLREEELKKEFGF